MLTERCAGLVESGADDATRRKARAVLSAKRARVTCLKVQAAYLLEALHKWCDLAESLVILHAKHQDHGEPASQELWDTIDEVVQQRDRMRLAAT